MFLQVGTKPLSCSVASHASFTLQKGPQEGGSDALQLETVRPYLRAAGLEGIHSLTAAS